ncbi:g31 [Coccomyxa viridis]|uniref:G31 protein n=1 Tax=Coccomyxa viridis TaxID=1274662 RepID=A0ABP1FET0_9CHLO
MYIQEGHIGPGPRMRRSTASVALLLVFCLSVQGSFARRLQQNGQAQQQAYSAPQDSTTSQAATAPASFQAADTSAQSAGVQAPSAGAYQGSNMQTQASTQGQADYQGSNLQQAPTFGLRQQAPSSTDQAQAPPPVQSVSQANPNKITNYYVDLAPGSSLDLGNQNGYPRIAATAPGRSVVVAQGPGQKNPDVSFDLGPQDTPVKVTLGRQQALDGGVSDNPQANDESGLSGSLNLGHYGVTQTNSFESVKVGGQGAELVTPFAKLQVPYQALTNFGQSFQQLPGQLQNAAKIFQVQSNGAPLFAPQAAPLAPSGSYAAQAAP